MRQGDARAVARAISIVEAGGVAAADLVSQLHPYTGAACIIGITGPPGAGKSTLVAQLIGRYRESGERVGVLAVDPSSPFSGGALLGDRVRMTAHALDSQVFIRSMASRGHLGGLAAATSDAAGVLDAAGFGIVIVETVGVGQDEVEVAAVSDVCVVTTVPGAGDDVQAMKAGIMEIADVFVINKADQSGADRAAAVIVQSLGLDDRDEADRPPVIPVVATTGEGLDELVGALEKRRRDVTGRQRRRRVRSEWRLLRAIADVAVSRIRHDVLTGDEWNQLVDEIAGRRQSANKAAEELVSRSGGGGPIDHIGIAAESADVALAFFRDALGLDAGPSEEVPSQGVRARFVGSGDTRIEVVERAHEDAPFARSLRTRGPGLHHLALRVDDLASSLQHLEARGVRLIDRVGRPGAHGTTVAFLHPSSTGGVLVELVEWRRHPREDR